MQNSNKLKFLSFALALLITLPVFGQVKKNSLKLPVIPGYELLKCDFHMHTVFSDGMVWPTVRVTEAYRDGLDAIALTDHIEYKPKSSDFTSKDDMRSFQIAEKTAVESGIILIKATEITRKTAPGHFNVLFLKDANAFEAFVNKTDSRDGSNIVETLTEAKNQGAYVFWNHPWFGHPENRSEWQKIHDEIYRKGLISGIEIVNGDRYDPLVFQWCLEKNLTLQSNTDAHAPITPAPGQYRSMTLVFAGERSEKGIREAMDNRRTVAYMDGNLYGIEEWVMPVVKNSLVIKTRQISDKNAELTIENISGIAYKMELTEATGITMRLSSRFREFTLDPLSQTAFMISSPKFVKGEEYMVKLKVHNVQVAPDKPLEYTLKFRL